MGLEEIQASFFAQTFGWQHCTKIVMFIADSPINAMKKHRTLLIIFALLAFQTYGQKKPNIIFIMSDDHTSQAVGVYGGILAPLNPTPELDKLASEGVIFTNTFCTNSICTPSRANIMTGQYSQTNGVLDLHGNLEPEEQYLAVEMGKLGYETAMVGKWHLKKEPGVMMNQY